MNRSEFHDVTDGKDHEFILDEKFASTKRLEYKPYEQCPHCSEYKLRLLVELTKPEGKWITTKEYVECPNCKYEDTIWSIDEESDEGEESDSDEGLGELFG